jgi:GrpB-like predicted nucleotidyltransferase (UPF0157 family)
MRVELVPHQDEWADQFAEEADRLKGLFGGHIIEIYHAGSTSIPGIKAKPVIDLVVAIDDIKLVERYNQGMTDLGYVSVGEFGIPGRRFFRRDVDGKRTHNVHIFQHDHPEIARMIAFRDYLREHPDEAKQYELLKEDLARQFPYDTTIYARGKSSYVEGVIRKARSGHREKEGH